MSLTFTASSSTRPKINYSTLFSSSNTNPLTFYPSQYLESLCDLLYDDLRPRILHEARLTALCEVCTVLQALMVLDAPISSTSTLFSINDAPAISPALLDSDSDSSNDSDSNDDDGDSFSDELNIDFDHPGREKSKDFVGKRLHTQHLLQMVLQDAQTRLFFKAQAVVQSEVRWYVPKAEDIAWPDVILSACYVSLDRLGRH